MAIGTRDYVPLNILITPDQKSALEEAAREQGISVSAHVRRLLTFVLKLQKPRRKK